MRRHKTGLLFGSFNPVHIGHMALVSYFLAFTDIDDLQLVLSPHNPLKKQRSLAGEHHRHAMLELALAAYPGMPVRVNTVELELPRPSYTVNTLTELTGSNPDVDYVLLIGADSLAGIDKWKDYGKILANFDVYVYPRYGFDSDSIVEQYRDYDVKMLPAPIIDVSATFIRNSVVNGHNLQTCVPPGVWDYMVKHKVYTIDNI